MTRVEIPNSLKRILIITLSLIFISTIVVVVIGESTKKIHHEIKKMNLFLEDSEEIQPNFERSLELYTEETKLIIEFLSKLRPSSKEELVEAISSVEKVAKELFLNLDLKSVEIEGVQTDSIDYQLSLYGTMTDLQNFLKKLEQLMLYMKIEEISFKDIKFLDDRQTDEGENINLRIKLYTK
ncbi:MAG: hypothetical protein ABID64_02350 [Nitrospirota bacterium]